MKNSKKPNLTPPTAEWLSEANETIRRVKILLAKYEDLSNHLATGTERQKALSLVFDRIVRDLREALEEPTFDFSEPEDR